MLEKTISTFIEEQFPNIYKEEGPFFVEFLKQYYVWLETDPSSPVYNARRYVEDHDIDTTVDDFVVYFKEKYLKSIQLNTATNTKQLVKNSIDLYRSKGTENAIKLFFDLIFSAPAEVYYPGKDVFKLSDADWVIPQYIEVTSMPVNRLLVGRSVIGSDSGATAFIERLVRRKIKNSYIEVFYISAINGSFKTGEIISLNTESDIALEDFPVMIGSLNEVEVLDGSTGFEVGDIVNLESKTGIQGKAVVSELNSVGGIVEFDLLDGGWGYTSNTEMNVSEDVLQLTNVKLTTSSNATMYDKMTHVSQPMANVQWYANTTDFSVGDTVYNYYSNGTLIGKSTIISAEYGTSNTTNYFLLSTQSGNTMIDVASMKYYTAGNTHSFTVQNAGHVDVTASANVTGLSSNVVINCTGSSSQFRADETVYQISTNNDVYARGTIIEVVDRSNSKFDLKIDAVNGMFLTNQKLLKVSSNTTANINYMKFDIGVIDTVNSFKTDAGNKLVFDISNVSTSSATIELIPFGAGANVSFDDDMVNTESVMLNPNYVRDHIDESEQANWVNSASYGASLNNANLNSPVLGEALQFEGYTLGTIAKLELANPGIDYSYPPIVQAIEPLVAPLMKMDFVIRINNATGVFKVGERVNQEVEGARGLVKFANTSEVHIRRMNYEDKWKAGSNTAYQIIGESTGFIAYPHEVTADIEGIAGNNAEISANVISSDSAVKTLRVTDSGFGFQDNYRVTFSSEDNLRAGTSLGYVYTTGIGSGYYSSKSGFLSDDKFMHDGDYYQDFAYEIKSPITSGRYADMLKNVLHVAGTKVFSSILSSKTLDSRTKVASSTHTKYVT